MQLARRDPCDISQQYFIIYVMRYTSPNRKHFDNKAELNGTIEACLKIMDLPDERSQSGILSLM